jgi:Clp amino terminal domain, pathogenicity island component
MAGMGKVNVYLPDDLERAVRAAGLSVSAICQTALQEAVTRLEHLRASGQGAFTPRLAAILDIQRAERAQQGRDVTARDLMCGILKHGENLGARAIAAMGVELPAPHHASRANGTGALAPDAVDALAGAYKVSLEMRHNYIGTEHVAIALAAEDSPVHDIFAALGVTDRLLRQQVERMLANPWTTQHVQPQPDPDRFDRLDQEVQRLAAELGRLRRDET